MIWNPKRLLVRGGSQTQSQTNKAEIYMFKSVNGIQITVLDTADGTRGIQKGRPRDYQADRGESGPTSKQAEGTQGCSKSREK